MLSLHTDANTACFLTILQAETFILVYMLVCMMAEAIIDATSGKSLVPEASLATLREYVSFAQPYISCPNWLTTSYSLTQARPQSYESLLDRLRTCCQKTREVSPQTVLKHIAIHFTKVSVSVGHGMAAIRARINQAILLGQSVSVNKVLQIHGLPENENETLFDLQLTDKYQIQIPTTVIDGVLDTATIHKAYYILMASNLFFRQLKPQTRNAIICRIVHDLLDYDNAVGHVWSMPRTFSLAAQIIQYQMNADWFEKSLQLRLPDVGVELEQDASDITAAFISMVFLISCGFPTPGGTGAGATNCVREGPVISNLKPAIDTVSFQPKSSRLNSRRVRSGSLPGYSRHWHAATQR